MKRLEDLLGTENTLEFNARAMRDFARQHQAGAVGAMHVTCSDESERECVDAFQHWFADDLLPELKFSSRSTFRAANLGGRYEWGSVTIADEHFTTPAARDRFKLLLVKINSHVCAVRDGNEHAFGRMPRYEEPSQFCGGLHAAADGVQLPAMQNLRETFRSEGLDRIAMLNDPQQVTPRHRSLALAVAGARLQARRALLDIQNSRPPCPTLYAVLPCVTFNRPQRDTELVVGMYLADCRQSAPVIHYRGLGDDPSRYDIHHRHNLVQIRDDQFDLQRDVRDHRRLVLHEWRDRKEEVLIDEEQVRDIVVLTGQGRSVRGAVTKEVLKTLLRLLADVALVPTAVLLFADGVAGIHNIYRAHRLAQGGGTREDAASILDEILHQIDGLTPDQARQVIQMLCQNYGITVETGDGPEDEGVMATCETSLAEPAAAENLTAVGATDELVDERVVQMDVEVPESEGSEDIQIIESEVIVEATAVEIVDSTTPIDVAGAHTPIDQPGITGESEIVDAIEIISDRQTDSR